MPQSFPFIEILQQRLLLPLSGVRAHTRMAGRHVVPQKDWPQAHKTSAVLCLFIFKERGWHILLIKRIHDNGSHSGQLAFPGGRAEQEDASLAHTALRETEEEVGIAASDVTILGALSSLYIPVSNYVVHPYIGVLRSAKAYKINRAEVAEVIEIPIQYITDAGRKGRTRVTTHNQPARTLDVPVYYLDNGLYVWGATAMMLAELEDVLKELPADTLDNSQV